MSISYEVYCGKCSQLICVIDRNPGLSVHYVCPKGVSNEKKDQVEDVATRSRAAGIGFAASYSRSADIEED